MYTSARPDSVLTMAAQWPSGEIRPPVSSAAEKAYGTTVRGESSETRSTSHPLVARLETSRDRPSGAGKAPGVSPAMRASSTGAEATSTDWAQITPRISPLAAGGLLRRRHRLD